jgi:hypothetical protein
MEKNQKNPLLAGVLNMLLPGFIHVYLKKEWLKFILTFVGLELVLAIVIWFGSSLQNTRSFGIPQGLCPGALALFVLVPLFVSAMKATTEYNKILDSETMYQSQKPVSQDDDDEQLRKIQKLRDDGLISAQQYDTRKNRVGKKK